MKSFITLITLICFGLNVYTQTPQAISYQAIARDGQGQTLSNTQVGLQLSILEGAATGKSVYVERHYVTTNEYGLINLKIGEGVVQKGVFNQILWGYNLFFTKIEIDIAGGTNFMEIGISQMLAVPYAFHAETANTINLAAGEGISMADNKITNTAPNVNQSLSLEGNKLTISNGNTITLPYSEVAQVPPGGSGRISDIANNQLEKVIFLGEYAESSVKYDKGAFYYINLVNEDKILNKVSETGETLLKKALLFPTAWQFFGNEIEIGANGDIYVYGYYYDDSQNAYCRIFDSNGEFKANITINEFHVTKVISSEKFLYVFTDQAVHQYNLAGDFVRTFKIAAWVQGLRFHNNGLWISTYVSAWDDEIQLGNYTHKKGEALIILNEDLEIDLFIQLHENFMQSEFEFDTQGNYYAFSEGYHLEIYNMNHQRIDQIKFDFNSRLQVLRDDIFLNLRTERGFLVVDDIYYKSQFADPNEASPFLFQFTPPGTYTLMANFKTVHPINFVRLINAGSANYIQIIADGPFYNNGTKYNAGTYLVKF
jgi:predicted phage tail protein